MVAKNKFRRSVAMIFGHKVLVSTRLLNILTEIQEGAGSLHMTSFAGLAEILQTGRFTRLPNAGKVSAMEACILVDTMLEAGGVCHCGYHLDRKSVYSPSGVASSAHPSARRISPAAKAELALIADAMEGLLARLRNVRI